jgi:rare lipoprotein A
MKPETQLLNRAVGAVAFIIITCVCGCVHFGAKEPQTIKAPKSIGKALPYPLPHPPKPVSLPESAEKISRYGNHTPYSVLGKTYQIQSAAFYREEGIASWYGKEFHGKPTSNFEPFDMYEISAAHKTLPLPTYVKVTNLENNRSMILRVNDRGPFHEGRIIDLSYAAAVELGFANKGTTRARVETILPPYIPTNHPLYALNNSKQTKEPQLPPKAVLAENTHKPEARPLSPNAKNSSAKPYLQLGAFSILNSAKNLATKIDGLLSYPLEIQSENQSQREIHKVQIGPLENQHEINAVKESLKQAQMPEPLLVWR